MYISCDSFQAHPCRLCIISILKPPGVEPEAVGEDASEGHCQAAILSSMPIGYDPVALGPRGECDEEDVRGSYEDDDNAPKRENLCQKETMSKGNVVGAGEGNGFALYSEGQAGQWDESSGDMGNGAGLEAVVGEGGIDESLSQDDTALLSLLSSSKALSDQHSVSPEQQNGVREDIPISSLGEEHYAGSDLKDPPEGEHGAVASFWSTPEGVQHLSVTAAFLSLSYFIAISLESLDLLLSVRTIQVVVFLSTDISSYSCECNWCAFCVGSVARQVSFLPKPILSQSIATECRK